MIYDVGTCPLLRGSLSCLRQCRRHRWACRRGKDGGEDRTGVL